MKSFTKIVLVLAATAATGSAWAQDVSDSCLDLYQNVVHDPDLIANDYALMIDTCNGPQHFHQYGKKNFTLRFAYYFLEDSITPSDDTINRNWRDIDTQFSAVRDSFYSIENRFGSFFLNHRLPDITDTNNILTKSWELSFAHYVNVDTAIFYLTEIPEQIQPPNFHDGLSFLPGGGVALKSNDQLKVWQSSDNVISFIGSDDIHSIHFFDLLGQEIKCPLQKNFDGISADISSFRTSFLIIAFSNQFFKIIIRR